MTEGKAEVREEITEVTATETEAQAAQAKTVSEEEFAALKREIPEIADKDALPAEVLEEAKEQSISLLDAYLRYRMREERYVQAERLRQQRKAPDRCIPATRPRIRRATHSRARSHRQFNTNKKGERKT